MSFRPDSRTLTRRSALAGLGAGGFGLALAARPTAGQDAPTDVASHPVVGLWQTMAPLYSDLPPDPAFEVFHADGTYTTWSGWDLGAALGIWRPTGARTAEVLYIWVDTSPFPTGQDQRSQRGTATFTFRLDVDEANTTLTYADGTMDLRDAAGTHLGAPSSFAGRTAIRVTFDTNPATGSTVLADSATPPGS
jgi:hypothetical protein